MEGKPEILSDRLNRGVCVSVCGHDDGFRILDFVSAAFRSLAEMLHGSGTRVLNANISWVTR